MQFTGQQLVDAIKKNSYEHLHKHWTEVGADGKFTGGCAVGQGLINLNLNDVQMANFIRLWWDNTLVSKIVRLNDTQIGHHHNSDGECVEIYRSYEEIVKVIDDIVTPNLLEQEFKV